MGNKFFLWISGCVDQNRLTCGSQSDPYGPMEIRGKLNFVLETPLLSTSIVVIDKHNKQPSIIRHWASNERKLRNCVCVRARLRLYGRAFACVCTYINIFIFKT